MKKVLVGLLVVVILIGGGAYYVFSNLDEIVKTAIETAGTDAVGSAVTVDSVAIDLAGGSASIYGFAIANPSGFSNATMLSFDELSVALNLSAMSSELVAIRSIVARNPYVLYETGDNGSNVDAVSARFASDESAVQESGEGADINLSIDSILIEDIEASLVSPMLPNPVAVKLGDINLADLQGTPEQIADQIMAPLLSQLGRTAANALLSAASELLQQDLRAAGEQVQQQAEERLEELEDTVNERIDEAVGEDVREGLGNLLRRN